jgi:hypothetical protein
MLLAWNVATYKSVPYGHSGLFKFFTSLATPSVIFPLMKFSQVSVLRINIISYCLKFIIIGLNLFLTAVENYLLLLDNFNAYLCVKYYIYCLRI